MSISLKKSGMLKLGLSLVAMTCAASVQAKTLVYCSEGSPEGFNPQLFTSGTTYDASSVPIYNRLVEFKTGTTEVIPGLAEKWEISEDGKTYTFKIRDDAKWSNGDPVTAADFVYSYRRGLSPGLGAEYATLLFALKNGRAFYEGKIPDFAAVGAVAAGPRTPDLAEAARRRNQALVAWFEPHRRSGALRDLPCELMPSLVMGPVQSYCRAWLSGNGAQGGLPSPTTYRAELADAAWRSVKA